MTEQAINYAYEGRIYCINKQKSNFIKIKYLDFENNKNLSLESGYYEIRTDKV